MEKTKQNKGKLKPKETEGVLGKVSCADKLCPFHGSKPLKLRGRIFEGTVIKKLPGRVAIQFERMMYVPKYERYEKAIMDELTDLIIDHELTKIRLYNFGKKKKYIIKSEPYSFDNDSIIKVMKEIDLEKYISICDNKIYDKIKNN